MKKIILPFLSLFSLLILVGCTPLTKTSQNSESENSTSQSSQKTLTSTSETSTVGAWGTQVAHCFFGQVGCTDMVIQRDVTVQRNKVPDKTGYNFLCYDLYGIKTFVEGANRSMKVYAVA